MTCLHAPHATAVHSEVDGVGEMRLQGRWLLLARASWVALAALIGGLFALDIPVAVDRLQRVCAAAVCLGHSRPRRYRRSRRSVYHRSEERRVGKRTRAW